MVLLAYFFYFFQDFCYGPRFYFECIPFLILLSARGVEEWMSRLECSFGFSPLLIQGWVYPLLVLFFLAAFGTVWVERYQDTSNAYWGTQDGVAEMVKQKVKEKNAVIFVEDEYDFAGLFSFLEPSLDRGWIAAHDYGPRENMKLLKNYPQWPVYIIRRKEVNIPYRFEAVLEPYAADGSPLDPSKREEGDDVR